MHTQCTHKPERLHTWYAYNCVTSKKDWLCVACNDCGEVLKGSDDEFDAYLEQNIE